MTRRSKVLQDLEERRSILEGIKPPAFPTLGAALAEYGHRCRERAKERTE